MKIISNLQSLTFVLLALAIPLSVAVTNILIVFFVVLWIFEADFKRKFNKLKNTKWLLSILILALLYLLGLVSGEFHSDYIHVLKRVLLLLFFIPVITTSLSVLTIQFPVINTSLSVSTYKTSIFLFLIANLISAITALLINFEIISPLYSDNSITAFLKYNYHNILLSFSALFSFLLFAKSKNKYSFVFLLLILIYTLSIFTEAGRAGQLTFNFFFFLFAIFYFKKKIKYSLLIISFLICVNLLSYSKSPIFKHRVDHLTHVVINDGERKNPKTKEKDIRYLFVKHGLELIYKKPIFGYGTGAFSDVFKKHTQTSYDLKKHKTPHNNYLYVLFELGLIGLLVFLSIFFFQIKELYKNNMKNPEVLLLPFFLILLMFFDSYMFIFSITLFYIYMYKIFKNIFN